MSSPPGGGGFDAANFPWGDFFRAQRNADIGLSLGRIEQNVAMFSGEKPTIEPPIDVWLDRVEKRCDVEKVAPEGVISFLVCGGAREVFETLNIAEAKDWSIVKDLLSRSFGLTDKAAFERYRDRKLGEAETVDVYIGELKRCATQIGISHDSKAFRLQVLSGIPREVEGRLGEKPDKFTKPLREFMADVRDRVATYRAESERRKSRAVGAGPSRELGAAQSGLVCFRCQGKGHYARDCASKPVPGSKRARSGSRSRTAPTGGCWICQGNHYAEKCPQRKAKTAANAGSGGAPSSSFAGGDAARGTGQSPKAKPE